MQCDDKAVPGITRLFSRKSIVLVLVVGVIVAAAAIAVVLLTADDSQSKIDARRGDAPPRPSELNRADDYGADVVRAYLKAALQCSPAGGRVMAQLSRPGESAVRRLIANACARSGGRPFAEHLKAEVAQEDLDERGRALWRVSGSNGALADDLVLRVRQGKKAWEIDRSCRTTCPR